MFLWYSVLSVIAAVGAMLAVDAEQTKVWRVIGAVLAMLCARLFTGTGSDEEI